MSTAVPINPLNPGEVNPPILPQPVVTDSAWERVKPVAAKILFAFGLCLLLTTPCLLLGHVLHLIVIDVATTQTLFYCGLAALLAGSTQKNYRGRISLTPTGSPFSLTLEF